MGFLFSLLSGIPGVIGTYFTSKANTAIAASQTEATESTNDTNEAISTLGSTSARFKEGLVFVWFIPFMLTIFWPSKSAVIFNNMHYMPQWYLEECIVVFNTVFGITVGTTFLATMFTHITKFTAQSQNFKLAKAVVENPKGSATTNVTVENK